MLLLTVDQQGVPMNTTAALNMLLFLIPVALFAVVFGRPSDPARKTSRARLGAAFAVGLASSVLGYVVTGLEGWEDFHLSAFVSLAITLAASVLIARSDRPPARYCPIALSGCLGILGPPLLAYALLAIVCIGGCTTS